jgi:AcrR family transcriptional regulator
MNQDEAAMASAPAKKKVRAAKAALYRQLVLEAAERVFARSGYDDSKMDEIAAESGLSVQTVYGVFAGKAEIFRAIHEAGDRALLDRAVEAARGLEEPLAALRAGVRAYTLYFLERPDFLRMHLREGLTWGTEGAGAGSRDRTEAWRTGVQMLTTAFRRCIDDGLVVERDPALLARMMIAMQQVELAVWLEGEMRTAPETVVQEIERQIDRSFLRR